MSRVRANYVFGATDVALIAGDTTLSSPALARLPVVVAPDVAAVTLHSATAGTHEIVHVTAHTAAATTATILRGRESTTAQAWASGTTWNHGVTAYDLQGAEMAVWERDLQTNFTYPAVVEYDRQASPILLSTTRNLLADIEITVTAGMLVPNIGHAIPYDTVLFVLVSLRCAGGTGNVQAEVGHFSVATQTETILQSSQWGGPSTGQRFALGALSSGCAVGDKVRLRIFGGNAANWALDWYAVRPLTSRYGKVAPGGTSAIYRNIITMATPGAFVPATVLSVAPTTWEAGSDMGTGQYLDADQLIGINATPGLTSLIGGPKGFYSVLDGLSQTKYITGQASGTKAQVYYLTGPSQLKFDRLAIPAP